MTVSIKGLQKTQAAMLKTVAAVKPDGKLDGSVKKGTIIGYGMAVSYTHVLTGSLRASHKMERIKQAHWRIRIDEKAVNPQTKQKPFQYGVYEHNRGGTHAFYEQVFNHANQIAAAVFLDMNRNLP